jgi:hypothetical protein
MPGVVQWILSAKVSAADLERALAAINALPPEERSDIAARVACLIEVFSEPGRHEVCPRVAAIDWRLQALARMADCPELKHWSLPGCAGAKIPAAVLEAAAAEPLIASESWPAFDAESFFKHLLSMTQAEGHG